jgi:uncharacterized protein
MRRLMPLFVAGGAMIASMPAAAQLAPVAPAPQPVAGTVLDVSAEGAVTRVPDIAIVRAGVVSQAATAAAAAEDNAGRMAAVVAALRRAGIAARDIQTAQLSLEPRYQYGENQPPVITGYQASNSVQIRFRDIARAGTVVDTLVREGANQIDGPTLTLDAPETALDEARTDAIRVARARAELYARAAGLRVVRILAIAESGSGLPPMPMPAMRMMARSEAASADTPIVPGEQRLTVTVQVRFELQ